MSSFFSYLLLLDIPDLMTVDLGCCKRLHTLRVRVRFDPGIEPSSHVLMWGAIQRLVLSLPNDGAFRSLELEGAFPHSLLN